MAFDVRQYAKRKMEQENQAEVQGTSASRVNKINTGEQKFDVRTYARAQGKAASPKAQVNTQASAVKRPTIGMQARKLEGTEYGRMLDAYRRGEDASVLMGQPERFTDDEYRASVERVLGRTVDWDADNAYSAVQDMLRGASDQRTGTRSAYREAGIEGLEDMVTYLRAREQVDARIAEQQERIQAAERAYADNEAWFRSMYETYSQMPDFEEMSRYSPPEVNERMAVWTGADLSHIGMQGPGVVYNVRRQMYENPTYVYVNDSTQRGSLDMASGTTIFGGNRLETSSNQAAGYDQLTPEEVQVYNYIYATQGSAAADRFLLDAENGIAPMLQYRAQNANAQRVGEAAKESPYFATAVSFPYRVADVMVAPTKMLATAMGTYDETLDHFGNTVSSIRDNAKQEVAADLDGLLPDGFVRGFASVAGKTPGEMAYDVGVNIVDMAVSRSIAGAMPGATQYMSPQEVKNVGRLAIGLMSLGATGSRISEGIQGGETPQRALVNGVAEGAMEALTEKLPMEAWMSDPGNAWQYLAKNFLSEGGEEGVNAVMQQAWDLMFNGENSRFAVTMQEAIASGKNGNDAFVIAFADALQEVLVSSVEGGLSGAVSAAPVAAANAASNLSDTAKERSGRKATADFFDQINTSVLGGEFSREGKGIAAIRTQGEAIAAELDRRASEMTGDTANYMRNLAAEVRRGVTTTATVGREWKQYADELIAESRDMGETDLNRQAAERLEKKGKVSNRMLGDVYRENLIRQAQMEGETETEADAETEAAPEDLEYKPGPAAMKASVTTDAGSAEADILGVTGQGKDAVIRMRAADGAEVTVPVAEAEIEDENTRALVDHAVELDYAQPMIAAYNRGQDAGLYATGFELAREYGYWNRMTEEQLLKSDVLTGLTDRQKLLAYQLGVDARAARDAQEKEKTAARRERAREAARKFKGRSVDKSAISGMVLTENQRTTIRAAEQLSEALGINVVIGKSIAESRAVSADTKHSPRIGYTADGTPVYTSNFPKGTTRKSRQDRILQLVQDVWSKNPIALEIVRDGKPEIITAQFDPRVDYETNENTDATKLAYGNKKGTMSDQKTTEKLADDFPEIIATSNYTRNKEETGGKNSAHDGVRVWHYFANRIGFVSEAGTYAEYNVSIDVKENERGTFVYSVAAEKEKGSERLKAPILAGDPKTILASVNGIAPVIANTIIAEEAAARQEAGAEFSDIATGARVFKGDNGWWDPATMTMYLDINAGVNVEGDMRFAVERTMMHEVTHYVYSFADESLIRAYEDFVITQAMRGDPDGTIRERLEKAEFGSKEREEIVAEASENVTLSEETMTRLAEQNRTLWEKIRDFLKKWVEDLRTALAKARGTEKNALNAAARAVEAVQEEVDRMFGEALVSAQRNRMEAMRSDEVEADIAEEIAGKIREGEDVRKNERYDYGQYPNSAFYENGELYSYDFLTAQKEMTVVEVPTMEELDSNKEYRNIRKNALRQARENLENVAERKEGDFYHLRNRYTQRIIKVAAGVAAHGLSTANQNPIRLFNNAANATKLGNLVQNAIPINGLKTIDNQVAGTYAMIAMTKDKNGREFINILTIEIRSETVTDVETFQQLHSANARKRKETLADKVGSGQPLQKQNATLSQSASPTISIRDLLAVVNRTHKSILSKDVLMRLNGTTETNGDYTDDAMFSKRSPTYPAALREAMGMPEDARRSDRKRVYEVTDQELLLGAAINARTTEERRLLNQYKSAVMEYTEQREKMQPAHELVLEEKRLMEQNGGKDKTNYFAALNKENTVKRGMERAKRLIDELVKDPDLQRMIEREKNLMHGLTLTSEKQREAEARERIRTVVTERTEKLTEKLRKREREYRDNLIEQFSHERYFNAIERTSKSLTRKLTQPKTGAYVPEVLQKPILDLLTSIDAAYNDYDTVRNRKISEDMVRLAEVSRRLMDREAEADSETQDADTFLREIDLPRGLAEQFTDLAERVERAGKAKGGVLKNMSAAELKALSEALTIMNTAVENSNKLLANARYGTVEKLGTGSMGYLRKQRSSKSGGTKLGNYLNWRNATPVNAFDRFGDAGRSVFGELQDAQDKLAELAKKVIAFTGEAYKPEEAKAWSEEEVTIELGPEINPGDAIGSKAEEMGNTRKVTMTVAQAMSVYCLAKREAARHHMTGYRQEMRNEDGSKSEGFVKGGGIRIENYERKGKWLRPGEKVVNSTNIWLSEADVEAIGKALTERQKSVATALQTYMSTTLSDWGNWVTLRRFGVHGFEEQNYFPMEVNPNALGTRSIEIKESLYRLLNMGFTKRLTERAKNPIMVRNIFDVFARHAGEMAMYRAYALPVLDAIKWLNYKESDTQTLQGEMERVFGREAINYVITLLQDINGKVGDNGVPELFDSLMRNYKIAAVGASLSTSLMQPTSYLRAAAMLDAKYLAIGARDALKNMEVAKTKVGIAQWKDLGYYDTNIGRSLASQIRQQDGWREKVVEKSMLLAKKGDEWTMGAIYGAVVAETQDLHPELKGEEFDAKVNERMRDIVYRTQVVDSPLMKSQFMRNKSYFAKLHTAFMAEPTVTANLLMSYFWQAGEAMRMGVSRGTAMKMYGRQAGRILTAWMAATALETLVRSLIGALRDDDDYENYWDKLLEQLPANFVKAINPLSLVPLIGSGVEAILTGESVTDMSTEPLTGIYQAVKNIVNLIQGKDVTGYKVAYDLLRAISQATGIPISNATRDVVALWNTGMDVFGATGMKLQTYQDSDSKGYAALYDAMANGNGRRAEWLRRQLATNGAEDEATRMRSLIKDDYNSGAIDADEAMRRLTEYAGDGENTAYWKVREWDAKAGGAETWSKADEVIDAILNGGDWRAEWQNLITYATSADYDDSDARSAVRSRIKTLLVNGRISEDTARWLLATCIYPTDREAREAVEAWLEAMEEEE